MRGGILPPLSFKSPHSQTSLHPLRMRWLLRQNNDMLHRSCHSCNDHKHLCAYHHCEQKRRHARCAPATMSVHMVNGHFICCFDPVGLQPIFAHLDAETMTTLDKCVRKAKEHLILCILKQTKLHFLHAWKKGRQRKIIEPKHMVKGSGRLKIVRN